MRLLKIFLILCVPSICLADSKPSRPNHDLPQFQINKAFPLKSDLISSTALQLQLKNSPLYNISLPIPHLYSDNSEGSLEQIARMADNCVQQTDIGSMVAPLDSKGRMPADITGDVSIASTKTIIPGSIPRMLADRANDIVNVRDYGAVLDGNNTTSDIQTIETAFSVANAGDIIVPAQGKLIWPKGNFIPTSSAQSRVIVEGNIVNIPRFPVQIYNQSPTKWVTDFGAGRPSFTAQSYDADNAFVFSRVEHDGMAYRKNIEFININNNGKDFSSVPSDVIHPGLTIYSASTPRSRGGQDGITQTYDDSGMNGFTSPEVAYHPTMNTYGIGWSWVFNPVLNEYNGWACGSDDWAGKDSTVGACVRAMSEWDLDISGPERPSSYWNPQSGTKSYINLSGWVMPNLKWNAGMYIKAHQMIDVKNPANHNTYIYESATSGQTGKIQPFFRFNEQQKITDNNVKWMFKGLKHAQISKGISIGSQNGIEFGTFLETEASALFYNAIMDFSLAKWVNSNNETHAWIRTPVNSWWDMSANGTKEAQGIHRLGFSTAYYAHLSYKANNKEIFQVDDQGTVRAGGLLPQNRKIAPSSSHEACNSGEFYDDEHYHYFCVKNNMWKRVGWEKSQW